MKSNVYIDESGTNKLNNNSSIAFVYIKVLDQEIFDKRILSIEKELGIKTFHWVAHSWKVREKFLDKVLSLDFVCKIMISHNPVNPDDQLEKALKYLIVEKEINNLTIDGDKSKTYTARVKKILRNKNITTKKIRGIKDEASPGIRVADMCAGLSRYYYDNKSEQSSIMFNKLKSKIEIIFEDL
jgi:hypothetical protein